MGYNLLQKVKLALKRGDCFIIHSSTSAPQRDQFCTNLKEDICALFPDSKVSTFEAFSGKIHGLSSLYKDVGTRKNLGVGQVGCILSHLSVWRSYLSKAETEGYDDRDVLLVFEDDVYFQNKDLNFIEKKLDYDFNGYEYFYFDHRDFSFLRSQNYQKIFINKDWYISEQPLLTSAYAIRLSLIKKFITGHNPYFKEFDQPLDWLILRHLKNNRINHAQMSNTFLGLVDTFSTIMN